MEVVAAAASVAGIITLVFQSIDGLVKFKELFSEVSTASRTVTRLLEDVNSLIRILEDVRDILEECESQKKGKNFASLDLKLADCSRDVTVWLSTARLLRPVAEHGSKAWFKKFKVAVNRDAIQSIRDEIGRHRQFISLSLSVLGRNIDLDISGKMHQIEGSMSKTLSIQDAQEAALERIENYSRASLHGSAHSIRSMNTIRSELSRLEAMITGPKRLGQTDSDHQDATNDINKAEAAHLPGTPIPKGAVSKSTLTHRSPGSVSQTGPDTDTKSLGDHYAPHETSGQSAGSQGANHESSFLYASFSRATESPATNIQLNRKITEDDTAATYDLLRQSLYGRYPPCVAAYISQRNLLTTSIRYFANGSPLDTSTNGVLRERIGAIEASLSASRQRCIYAGYSLAEIDRLLLAPLSVCSKPSVQYESVDSDEEDWIDASERMAKT